MKALLDYGLPALLLASGYGLLLIGRWQGRQQERSARVQQQIAIQRARSVGAQIP